MTIRRQEVGKIGETAAADYLIKQDYYIIDRNYRCPIGEIDLIALDGNTVVFVEVRTRTGSRFGAPEESIRSEKARKLVRLAQYYLQKMRLGNKKARIDLVAVTLVRDNLVLSGIRHIKGILSG